MRPPRIYVHAMFVYVTTSTCTVRPIELLVHRHVLPSPGKEYNTVQYRRVPLGHRLLIAVFLFYRVNDCSRRATSRSHPPNLIVDIVVPRYSGSSRERYKYSVTTTCHMDKAISIYICVCVCTSGPRHSAVVRAEVHVFTL